MNPMLEELVGKKVQILTNALMLSGREKINVAISGILVDFDEDNYYLNVTNTQTFDTVVAKNKVVIMTLLPDSLYAKVSHDDERFFQ